MGLSIHLKEIEKEEAPKGPESNHLVTVSGYDRPGIVYKTTETLAKWGANITDLETKVVRGKEKNIYIMVMEVFLPENIDKKFIEATLKSLGESLGVTITVKPIESYEAL
jgi:glycine cleavage system transcriptional repressor